MVGFGQPLGELADAGQDERGLMLDEERFAPASETEEGTDAAMKRRVGVCVGDRALPVGTLRESVGTLESGGDDRTGVGAVRWRIRASGAGSCSKGMRFRDLARERLALGRDLS